MYIYTCTSTHVHLHIYIYTFTSTFVRNLALHNGCSPTDEFLVAVCINLWLWFDPTQFLPNMEARSLEAWKLAI